MSFQEQIDLAESTLFVRRVKMALVKAALAVAAEDAVTGHHTTRVQWATQVLRDPDHYAKRMVYGVAANAAITADSTDSDIEFTVNSIWNAYAGVITAAEVQ